MNKEFLLEILNKRLFFELIIIIMAYSVVYFTNFKLGFRILGVKIGLKKILPGVCLGIIYSLFGKQILPDLAYGFFLLFLFALLLVVIGKVSILKALWTSLLTILITSIGVIVIEYPMCSLNKSLASFLFKTPYGYVVGSLIESLFPALTYFILPKLHISLIPPINKKITHNDIIGFVTYGMMYCMAYFFSVKLYTNIKNGPRQILSDLIFEWLVMILIILGHYLTLNHVKKQREYERQIIGLLKENRELANLNNQLKLKNVNPQEVTEVFDGIILKLQNISQSLINSQQPHSALDVLYPASNLNDNELKIIELIARGKCNKEIAAAVFLSEGRVKNIITKLLEKLGLTDRTQLAVYAVKNNLVEKNEKTTQGVS